MNKMTKKYIIDIPPLDKQEKKFYLEHLEDRNNSILGLYLRVSPKHILESVAIENNALEKPTNSQGE